MAIGTLCQVGEIKSFLNDYEKLITVDSEHRFYHGLTSEREFENGKAENAVIKVRMRV